MVGNRGFDVRQWMSGPHAGSVRVSQPVQLACYTRESELAGGGVVLNSKEGEIQLVEQYTRKAPDAAIGIEPVVQALNSASQSFAGCDICTFRNNLNKIAMTLLNPKDGWEVDGCLFRERTLFLDIRRTQETAFPNADLMTYYGYKFEAVCTGSQTTDATSEFCSVVRLRLGRHSIFMAAEVDAFDPSAVGRSGAGSQSLESYLELKTYKIPRHRGQALNLKRFKHPRWWVQSFLAGVPYLVLGGRDEQGMLQTVERVKVSHLHQQSAAAGCDWEPTTFLHFLEDVLSWMREVAGESPGKHLRFTYSALQGSVTTVVLEEGDLPGRLTATFQTPDFSSA